MKIFISWSGQLSKSVAQLLSSWLEDVLQGTETWLSTDDIDKGSLWFGDLATQLSDTGVGILCLTRENQNAPWILFEAGALSKGLSKNRVCPFLVDLEHADLGPPLSQFNGTLPIKDDVSKLVKTINNARGDQGLPADRLEKAFGRWWDDFEKRFNKIVSEHKPKKQVQKRSTEDMVEEILELARSIQRSTQEPQAKTVELEAPKTWLSENLLDSDKNMLGRMLYAQLLEKRQEQQGEIKNIPVDELLELVKKPAEKTKDKKPKPTV
jgi:hypothetical protein